MDPCSLWLDRLPLDPDPLASAPLPPAVVAAPTFTE
jgi:hypothetical protein